jgi:hypothetical protein
MREDQIEQRIERIKRELLTIGPMRPGTLSRQYSACQKPGCKCVDPVNPRKHGPFYQLSFAHQGKSSTRFIRPPYVAAIQKELAAYKRYRELTQEWVSLAVALSQMRLEQARKHLDPPVPM